MSLEHHFIYDTDDKAGLEVPEFSCSGMQDLFELLWIREDNVKTWEWLKNETVLYPEFVRDMPKMRNSFGDNEQDDDIPGDDADYEEIMDYIEGIEDYVGPSFPATELIAWGKSWISLLEDASPEHRRGYLPLFYQNSDAERWFPILLKDLRNAVSMAECAERHEVPMRIEFF